MKSIFCLPLLTILLLSACYSGQRREMLALLDEADSLNRMTQTLADSYQQLGVPYEGSDTVASMVKPRKAGDLPDGPSTAPELCFYYHKDHLGSTGIVTDADGNIAQYLAYTPYGEVLYDAVTDSTFISPYKFNGKEHDAETGMIYYGARYYNPKYALWLSCDPLQEKYPGVSSYCYTFGNPVNFFDPNGMDGKVTGSGTPNDPYIITAVYIFEKKDLNENQVLGLQSAIDSYNGFGGAKGVNIGNHKHPQYVKFQLSLIETKDVEQTRLSTLFNADSENPRYFGNIVRTNASNGSEYGSADNKSIYYNETNIQGEIARGANIQQLYKSTMLHEIGHNLGGEHEDNNSLMNNLQIILHENNRPTYVYPSIDKKFVKSIFSRRDTKREVPSGRIWTRH